MLQRLFSLTIVAFFLAASTAQAHFVWVAVQKDSAGKQQAHIWFSELAEPDDEKLIDKIAQTQAWSRTIDSEGTLLKLAKLTQDGGGAWTGEVAAQASGAVSAHCNYGVLDKRGQVFLLHYYAKYLDAGHAGFKAFARDEKLALDVVPEPASGEKRILTVLFHGKPVTGSEVVVFDPAGTEEKLTTNDQGQVSIAAIKSGLYSIRAGWSVEEAGKEGDKEYKLVKHYSTLALRVPAAAATAASADKGEAAAMIAKARDGRAVWNNFTGFEADVTLFIEGKEQQGRIRVSGEGKVELTGLELKDEKALLSTLRSMVGHRMGSGSEDDAVSFADEIQGHPLGRLIRFDNDSAMGSHYRVKDDVVREVNRSTDAGKFTISVLEVRRNAEGKYLPGVYNVNFWNKDGSLKSNTTVRETWVRVGTFDLPLTHYSVTAGANDHRNVQLEFSNHKLLEKTAAK